MIKRYRLVLNVPNRRAGGWSAVVEVGRFRKVETALRAAERILARHPTEETRARCERWPWSASLYDTKGAQRCRTDAACSSAAQWTIRG